MIDQAYDGQVFNVAFSDVPEKKTDLVTGKYELILLRQIPVLLTLFMQTGHWRRLLGFSQNFPNNG